jgi:hypothetical protein
MIENSITFEHNYVCLHAALEFFSWLLTMLHVSTCAVSVHIHDCLSKRESLECDIWEDESE